MEEEKKEEEERKNTLKSLTGELKNDSTAFRKLHVIT